MTKKHMTFFLSFLVSFLSLLLLSNSDRTLKDPAGTSIKAGIWTRKFPGMLPFSKLKICESPKSCIYLVSFEDVAT